MKRSLFTLAIFLATLTGASAIEPKAGIDGPSTGAVGKRILIEAVGCQGDLGPFFSAEPSLAIEPGYQKDGTPTGYATARASVPGVYVFSIVMVGTGARGQPPRASRSRPASWPSEFRAHRQPRRLYLFLSRFLFHRHRRLYLFRPRPRRFHRHRHQSPTLG